MPNCPNCGQPTSRTRDWACQWCGYPLVSKAFRPIPKTYKELQEERRSVERLPVEREAEVPTLEPEPIPPPEIEPVAEVEAEPVVEPEREPVAEAEPEPVESEAEPKRRRKRVLKPKAAPEPEVEVAAEAEPVETKPKPRRRRKPAPEPEPEQVVEPEPEPVLEAEAEPTPEPEPVLKAEAEPTPEPEPVVEPETELTSGLIEVGIEGLYSAFTADRDASDARYKNRMLRVTGLLYRTVINENLDVAYIILTSAKKYGEWKVSCTFNKEHEKELRQLTTQQMVTVQGNYDGYRVNIQMRDCVLVR